MVASAVERSIGWSSAQGSTVPTNLWKIETQVARAVLLQSTLTDTAWPHIGDVVKEVATHSSAAPFGRRSLVQLMNGNVRWRPNGGSCSIV